MEKEERVQVLEFAHKEYAALHTHVTLFVARRVLSIDSIHSFIHSPGQLQRSTPEGAVLVAGKTPPSARLELPTSLLANSQCSTLSRLQNHHTDASIGVPCGVGQ